MVVVAKKIGTSTPTSGRQPVTLPGFRVPAGKQPLARNTMPTIRKPGSSRTPVTPMPTFRKTGGPPRTIRQTPGNKFPSAHQVRRAVMSRGGPSPALTKNKQQQAPKLMNVRRGPRVSERVGMVHVPRLVKHKTFKRIAKIRSGINPEHGKRVVKKGKVTYTYRPNKTIVRGPKGTWIVGERNKAVIKQGNKTTRIRDYSAKTKQPQLVKVRTGTATKTKADDVVWAKRRSENRASYSRRELDAAGKVERGLKVVRRAAKPRQVKVVHTGSGGGKVVKKLGPKKTITRRVTAEGKSTTKVEKTRYNKPGHWAKTFIEHPEKYQGPLNRDKAHWEKSLKKRMAAWNKAHKKPTGGKKLPASKGPKKGRLFAQDEWARVQKTRRLRRRRGAKFNQSLTKGQLRSIASRNLS